VGSWFLRVLEQFCIRRSFLLHNLGDKGHLGVVHEMDLSDISTFINTSLFLLDAKFIAYSLRLKQRLLFQFVDIAVQLVMGLPYRRPLCLKSSC